MNAIKQWIEDKKKNGSLVGLVWAPIMWLLIGIAVSTLFWSCEAEADYLFPEGPVMFMYADFPKDTPFCDGGGNEINSNAGIRQMFYKKGPVALTAHYTHHSCAFLKDKNVYDAVGFGIEWHIGR